MGLHRLLLALLALLALPAGAGAQVVISEVQAGGAGAGDEFVEVTNLGQPVELDGWVLGFSGSACEQAGSPFPLPAVQLGTGQHLLVGGSDYRGVDLPDASFTEPDRLPAAAGSVAVIPPESSSSSDALGYGPLSGSSSTCFETAPHPQAPPAGDSLERVQETNDNAADFSLRSVPNPENLSGAQRAAEPPPAPPPGPPPPPPQGQTNIFDGPQISSVRVAGSRRVGETFTLVVEAQDPGLPTTGIRVNWSAAEGETGLSACRLGRQSGPFIHGRTTTFEVPHQFRSPGTYELTVTVSSGGCFKSGRSTTFAISVVIEPAGSARASAAAAPGLRLYGAQLRPPSRCRGATGRVASSSLRRSQAAIVCLMNDVRRRAGRRLRPLRRSAKLTRSALAHSRDMTRRLFFEHVGAGGPTLAQRLRRARYRSGAAGENIGYLGLPTPIEMVNAWIQSPPHFRNMVSPLYRFAGVGIVPQAPLPAFPRGVAAATFTVNFGRGR